MLLSKMSTNSCLQFTDHRVEVAKVIPQGCYQRHRKSGALGDMVVDEGLDGMVQETEGDDDFRQCAVEQTHGMPVHAEFHSTRHRDVPGVVRGKHDRCRNS